MAVFTNEMKKGLRYLKDVLEIAALPGDKDLNTLFFKQEGEKITPLFDKGMTVAEVLDTDPDSYDLEGDVFFVAQQAYNMWNDKPADVSYFIETPNGSGRVLLTETGLKGLQINGVWKLQGEVNKYMKLQHELGDLLSTNGVGTDANIADLTDKNVWNRLQYKDKEGNFKPIPIDIAKFTGVMQNDRLEVLDTVKKFFDHDNLYVMDEYGVISKVQMTKNQMLYRGAYEKETLEALVNREIPDAHGPVLLFLINLLDSIGIHWFDGVLKDQEVVEHRRMERIAFLQEDRKYENDQMMKKTDDAVLPEFTRRAAKYLKRDMSAQDFEKMLKIMEEEGSLPLDELYTAKDVNINHDAMIARAMYQPAHDLLKESEHFKDRSAFLKKNQDAFVILHDTMVRQLRKYDLKFVESAINSDRRGLHQNAALGRSFVVSQLRVLDDLAQNAYKVQAQKLQEQLKKEQSKDTKKDKVKEEVKKNPEKKLESQSGPMKK